MPQAPGPRGSPHEPQAPIGTTDAAAERLPVDTAKTESCLVSAVPWHFGHIGVRDAVTSVSNWWSQPWQRYSKSGMGTLYRFGALELCGSQVPSAVGFE